MENTDLVRSGAGIFPLIKPSEAKARYDLINEFCRDCMEEDVDFGKLPGTSKDFLFQPGAEKLATFYSLVPQFFLYDKIEDWTGSEHGGVPMFYYHWRCDLFRDAVVGPDGRIISGRIAGQGWGSANSKEVKYAYRWVPRHELPKGLDPRDLMERGGSVFEFDFAVKKRETTGRYGKPEQYWRAFEEAISNGTATQEHRKTRNGKSYPGWTIDGTEFRLNNPEICSEVFNLQAMAKKRAFVDAVKRATNASAKFTMENAADDESPAANKRTLRDMAAAAGAEEEPPEGAPDTIELTRGQIEGYTKQIGVQMERLKKAGMLDFAEDRLREFARERGWDYDSTEELPAGQLLDIHKFLVAIKPNKENATNAANAKADKADKLKAKKEDKPEGPVRDTEEPEDLYKIRVQLHRMSGSGKAFAGKLDAFHAINILLTELDANQHDVRKLADIDQGLREGLLAKLIEYEQKGPKF